MLCNKRGQVSEEALFWIFFYLPLTIIVVFLIKIVPSIVLSTVYDTKNLENYIYQERALNGLHYKSPLTKGVYPFSMNSDQLRALVSEEKDYRKYKGLEDAFDEVAFEKEIGFFVSLDEFALYFNKVFYDDAKPLAPVRYFDVTKTYPVFVVDKKKESKLTVDQVFSPRMKRKDDAE